MDSQPVFGSSQVTGMPAITSHVRVNIPSESVAQFLLRSSKAHPDKPALIDGSTDRTLTYGRLHDDLRRAAAGLVRRGVRKGDVVAVFGPNSPDYVTAFYAVTSLGAVITSLNVIHNVAELSYQLIDSGAKVVLVTREPTAALVRAAQKAGITHIWRLDEVCEGASSGDADGYLATTLDARAEVASITYTEAASDVPMGVMVTHGNLVANVQQTQAVDPVGASDVLLGLMPFCQLYGMVAVNLALHASATVVTFPHFSLSWLLQAIERYRVTVAYLVPPVIRTLAKHGDVDKFDLSALKKITAFTAPLPDSVARACAERLQCNVRQAYGLTEAVALTHFTPRASHKVASVGVPVPDTECRVVDVVSRRSVGPGELGEVWVRGPQVTKGYHNFPEVTADILDDEGWLRTCDIGYIDEDEYLFVVDRSKKLSRLRGLHRQDGELLRAAVEDIAARLKASDKLRVQSVLLNSVRESVLSTDLNNVVTFWNKGAENLFGYSAREAIGRPVQSLIVPDGVEFAHAEKTQALRTHGTWNSQVMRRRKDGSIIWTDLVVSIVNDGGGERAGFLGIHRDVTEQRKAEERLRFQAQLLDSVLESVVATDLDGCITFWARGAESLFGYSAGEMLGRALEPLMFPLASEPDHEWREIRDQVLASGSWTGRGVPCRRKSADFWADVTFAPVSTADGRVVGIIAVHRDVTELRRNQELVKESHERTRSLAARLIAIREHERSSIARELHDELGQALTRLNIDVTWLTQRLPQRLKTKRVQAIVPLADRTVRTIQQISSQLRPPILDDLGLEAAIEWHVHEFGEWSGCRCELDLSVGRMSRDKDRDIAIFRILQEALTNVARHARAEVVKVRAIRTGDEFALDIEDDGIGIPASKVNDQHSFGLAGMAERAEGLGGELQVSVLPGKGTIVSLRVRIPEQASEAPQHDPIAHR
jgi:PAS domain S-box-containing protein